MLLPEDEHNAKLVANVHPPDWVNPDPVPRYNLVVIGAGTAGLVTAAGAAGLGAKVALVERHLMGGDCLNVGCVPSKALIASARVAAEARRGGQFGIRLPEDVEVDFPAVMERMRRIRAHISHHDSAKRFQSELGVDLFLGDAQFIGRSAIEVGGKTLRFKKAVVATGARAFEPPIPGLEEAGFQTNETIFSLTELPRRLVVIGGGPIGCELAQAFTRFGARVTIVEMGSQFLSREDPDAAGILARRFEQEGIEVLLEAKVDKVEVSSGGKILHVTHAGSSREIVADDILVGAGRTPNVAGLNLEAADVEYDKVEGVIVDDHLCTTNKRIFAAGDVAMRHKFTHAADAAARIVIQNALFGGRKKLSALVMPWSTYTDPEIAHVGMYRKDAEARGIEVDTFVRQLSDVDRALTDGDEEGFVKVHVRKGTDRILGATIVARHAGEMISELTLAMVAKAGLGKLSGVIHPYPTQAVAIKQMADAYNRTRLTPRIRRLFERWFAWTRR
jgi:pyruvate/2-oxoglutarate dehydrogenase complex dihydrolipoamide dehydrogenase (E3) component